jgi:cobalt-zinc-cadmium efflux system outer membrane protein
MFRFAVVAAVCLGLPVSAAGQTILTLEEALARARTANGDVAVARARIAEAEARLLDASARFRENPVIEGSAGPRTGTGARSTELDIGISQQFETGGQRRARIAAANAGVERQRAEVGQIMRTAVIEVASAFVDGLAATERLAVAEQADSVARELLNVTERRYALGDIAAIDVNLARIHAARTAAALVSACADLSAAGGRLRALLRLPGGEPIEFRGSLELPAPAPLDVLVEGVDQRPEFAVLAAEVKEADAQAQLGRALRRPDLGVRVGYEREEADTIVLGGLTVTWPAFQRGQGTAVAGSARATRARLETEIAKERAVTELRSAHVLYQQRSTLAATVQRDTTASLDDNETLARRSFEAGEMNVLDLLMIRRDAAESRLAVIGYRLDAARARLAVDIAAGVLR